MKLPRRVKLRYELKTATAAIAYGVLIAASVLTISVLLRAILVTQ